MTSYGGNVSGFPLQVLQALMLLNIYLRKNMVWGQIVDFFRVVRGRGDVHIANNTHVFIHFQLGFEKFATSWRAAYDMFHLYVVLQV